MNKDLIEFIKSDTPPLNPDLANGLATVHAERTEEHLNTMFKSILKELEEIGLFYLGFERMSVAEEFTELSKGRANSGRQYDLARTDTYMVKLKFDFRGLIIEKPLRIPFISQAGMMHIYGTRYSVTPVLADRIISVTPPKIFVRLLSLKLNFEKINHHFIAGGQKYISSVVKSAIYNNITKKRNKRFSKETPLVYYLLCKHGMQGMFRHFFNCEVPYGVYGVDIKEKDYPSDQWVICQSTGIKPKKLIIPDYIPCDIAFAVPIDKFTPTMKSIIAGIYYIIDQFSGIVSYTEFDDKDIWAVILGMVFYGGGANTINNPVKLKNDVNKHLHSIDHYIDKITKEKFRRIGMDVEDMYELLFIIIDKFDLWINTFMNQEADLYNKELSILNYLLSDLTSQMVIFYYNIRKKNENGDIKENDVKECIRKHIKTDRILELNRKHGEFKVVDYSGDNMAFGVTHGLTPQDKTTRGISGNDNIKLNDPSLRLHVSMAEVRTFTAMSKSAPDGSSKLNLHLNVDPDGGIIRNEKLQALLDRTQQCISRD